MELFRRANFFASGRPRRRRGRLEALRYGRRGTPAAHTELDVRAAVKPGAGIKRLTFDKSRAHRIELRLALFGEELVNLIDYRAIQTPHRPLAPAALVLWHRRSRRTQASASRWWAFSTIRIESVSSRSRQLPGSIIAPITNGSRIGARENFGLSRTNSAHSKARLGLSSQKQMP